MKKYKYHWFDGMIEDSKGEWIKEKEANKYLDGWISKTKILENRLENLLENWKELHTKYSSERIKSLLLTAALLTSILINIIQTLYYLN